MYLRAMSEPNDHVFDLVRRQDRGRCVAAMFAPAASRPGLLAVLALNAELARIPSGVSEVMLGQIKLQWWRDLIARLVNGEAAPVGYPLGKALADVVPALSADSLAALIDAREAELAGADQTATIEPVAMALAALMLNALGVTDTTTRTAAQEAAVAYGLTHPYRGGDVADHARAHIAAARSYRGSIDRRAIPVLLWATIAEATLRRPHIPPPVIRLTWNAWRGRY